jgi:hypothetical protein
VRTIGLHTQQIAVQASSDRARRVAEFVCASLESRSPREADEVIETPELADDCASAEELMRALAMRLVWNYSDGLALHGAVLERGGRAVLFPATSGSGKSTLAVHLGACGWSFATDELAFVPLGATEVHSLSRPAHLKPGSMFLVERFPALRDPRHVWTYSGGALIAPMAMRAPGSAAPSRGVLRAIVFPAYAPDAQTSLERLSSGSASFLLSAALVNARNLPQLGLAECARLATCTPAFRLTYRDLDAATIALGDLTARGSAAQTIP